MQVPVCTLGGILSCLVIFSGAVIIVTGLWVPVPVGTGVFSPNF